MIEVCFPGDDKSAELKGDLWVCLATADNKPGECSRLGNGIRMMYSMAVHPGSISVTLGAPGAVHIAMGEFGGAIVLVRRVDREPMFMLDYTSAKIGMKCTDAVKSAAAKLK
jgi:hypothetical protein